ncbi:MAG: J domain-containing protein [Burkholderiaceae bacterium]
MAKVHTHYDNLKVARNAPPEVIRAAYKTLSQRFHPDRNADNEAATRIFQIISTAYEVLSDPVKRKEHDEWIARTEAEAAPESMEAPRAPHPGAASATGHGHSFSRFSVSHHERSNALAMAFKGLTVKQRNFIFLFSGLIVALLLFIILS